MRVRDGSSKHHVVVGIWFLFHPVGGTAILRSPLRALSGEPLMEAISL